MSDTREACPLCGATGVRKLFHATDRVYRTSNEPFLIVECSDCRLMRLSPWPTLEELRAHYPDPYWFLPKQDSVSRLEELYRRFVLRDHLRFVSEAVRHASGGVVLDVGCGGGLFLRMLAERGLKVVGLDNSAGAAGIAWRVNGVPAFCATLAQAPLAPASCSAVTMFHVLEHLHHPETELRAAHTLLRPDGRLIVQTPNAASWQSKMLGKNWFGLDVPRHLVDYRASDLARLLDSCGFAVVREKHFTLRDNPACLATSLAPSIDPMGRRTRRLEESPAARLLKDLAHFGLIVSVLPFAALEAAFGAGGTVMLEARRKGDARRKP